jgi:peptide/nickel transport system substrate-binding protein
MKVGHFDCGSPVLKVLLVVLAILFTFCVGPANAASEPGTITIVVPAEPDGLDAGNTSRGNVGQVLMRNVFETLTERNPVDSSIAPRLATSWKQIDANTWHFFLRKGVKFHDGADFNANAVVFNIKRVNENKIDPANRSLFLINIKMDAKVVDSNTVEIKTEKFEPLLPTLMGIMSVCSPNTPADKVTRNPIGTGPYKLVTWDAGKQIVLERFDGYWGKQPPIKKAVYIWRTESAVRAAMVEVGEADLAPDIAKQDAKRPDMDYSYLNSETTHLIIHASEPPLNDKRVRMALNYAVDRNTIRGSILTKDVIPATQIIGPSIFGYNPELKAWPYDPKKARQLLDEARKDGVPVDKEILMVGRIGNFPGSDELLEAVMTMYKAVGLNAKLKAVEVGVYRPYQNKPYPPGPYILQASHDNNKGDATFSVFNNYHSKGLQSHISDNKLDEMIEKAQLALGDERRTLWRAVFKRIHEDIVPSVMLFHMVGYARVGKRINYKPSMATNNELQLEQMTLNQ